MASYPVLTAPKRSAWRWVLARVNGVAARR